MKINTRCFGEVEVNPSTVITFTNGILGFPNSKNYILIDHNEKSPLKWLQSVDEPQLAFVVTNPNLFKEDYIINIFKKDLEDLNVENTGSVIHLVIVTVPRDPSKMTANLRAPILINTENNLAKQFIIDDIDYEIKFGLIPEERVAKVI